jgi:predicted GNAT superfamily acetyltransferase
MQIRDAIAADFPRILALNEASVAFLSPLDAARLAKLAETSVYHRVCVRGGEVVGFLLAFAPGADYDSPNYRWFAERQPDFLYIDRIVVDGNVRGGGIGRKLYEDLFTFAAQRGYGQVTCEFDLDPPNPASEQFHARFGFREVGQQRVAGGKKLVSLQAARLTAALPAPTS